MLFYSTSCVLWHCCCLRSCSISLDYLAPNSSFFLVVYFTVSASSLQLNVVFSSSSSAAAKLTWIHLIPFNPHTVEAPIHPPVYASAMPDNTNYLATTPRSATRPAHPYVFCFYAEATQSTISGLPSAQMQHVAPAAATALSNAVQHHSIHTSSTPQKRKFLNLATNQIYIQMHRLSIQRPAIANRHPHPQTLIRTNHIMSTLR